jgi:glycosyltransferase involved in cell wall biosynthesis
VAPYGGEAGYEAALAAQELSAPRGSAVYGANLLDEVDRLAAVAGEIAATEPHDVIHVHDWITYRAGMRARAVSGRPLVAHIHATEIDRSGEHVNVAIAHREREGMMAADLVIANSHALRDQVITRYGIPAGKVAVVHWGIDEDPPVWAGGGARPFRDDEPVVLFLGRVTRQKGPDHFIAMARRVLDFVPDARFVIAGTGDMLPGIIERVVALGMADRVLFAGGLSGAEVDRAFQLARVCVMTSVSEPFGLVALESMRAGTPVIVPKTAGVAEVVRHALKVDFWDVEELTNKVVALLRHPALYAELRERGTRELEAPRFTLDEPARLVAEVYHRALRNQGAVAYA